MVTSIHDRGVLGTPNLGALTACDFAWSMDIARDVLWGCQTVSVASVESPANR
jgi:hypothetical protein